jgi:polysaccharide deacetylase 2 family uncharacterized protein YibQ
MIFRVTLVIGIVLVSLIIAEAFWETDYNPLQKHSSPAFPVEKSGQLQNIIETELSRSGILEVTSHKKTMQQDTFTWTAYEYEAHVEKAILCKKIIHALSEKVYANGGQVFQTHFRSKEPEASVVIGIDSFITHTLLLTWDVPQVNSTPTPTDSAAQFKAAIVIDDLGANEEVVYELLDLGEDLTFSILPHLEKSTEIARQLHERQKEILLHLPMEPRGHEYPGKGAIMMNMTPDMIRQTIEDDLQMVPYAVGVNNHMGSRVTANREKMEVVLQTLNHHNLFFLDSRTTGGSVAYKTAQQLGIKSARRHIFLDYDSQYGAVREQLFELASLAEQGKPAIAIGHPKPATLQALKEILPEFKRRNIKIVRLSQFVH